MIKYSDLPFISKVTNPEPFGNKVIAVSEQLGILPHWLMIVMNNESGLRADIKNPTSSASGLIQFIEPTATALGTTTAALRAMTNVDQMDYVYKYMKTYASKIKDVSDTYLTIFYPAALYKDDSFQFPTWVVKANPIFDINHDGQLTKSEFRKYVNDKYAQYLPAPEVVQKFQEQVKKKARKKR